MKMVLLLGLLVISTLTFSQQNNDILYFKVNNDTITFYLDDIGDITTKSKAVYYRSACIDRENLSYSGEVNDYYLNNQLAYKCFYSHNNLNGEVKCYYNNGQMKYHGYFNESLKDSVWTFFYENGNTEKIVHYRKDVPFVKEFYNSNGKAVFVDGNGKFKGTIIAGYKESIEYKISGKILNGKMTGNWNWTGPYSKGIDSFKEGEFMESSNPSSDFYMPRIISLTGFDLHENVDVFKFIAIPKGSLDNSENIMLSGIPVVFNSTDIESHVSFDSLSSLNNQLKYRNSIHLNDGFRKEFESYLIELSNKNQISNFWCFIQFTVNSKNRTENVLINSNINLISKELNKYISDINGFEPVKNGDKNVDCDIYLSIFYNNGKITIPEYNFNNLKFNLSNLKSDN